MNFEFFANSICDQLEEEVHEDQAEALEVEEVEAETNNQEIRSRLRIHKMVDFLIIDSHKMVH